MHCEEVMESAGDSSPNRKVSGFLAQDGSARSLVPGPNQLLGMTSPASALGASLRTLSGTLGCEGGAGLLPPSSGVGQVNFGLATL